MTVERRRHIRVVVPGAYCELIVSGATVGVVAVEDVSESGIFVAFPRPVVPAQTRVELRFIEEADPLVVAGVIVQVVQPGGARTPGYGIELTSPPSDTVERIVLGSRAPVATVPKTAPPSSSPPSSSSPSSRGAPSEAVARAGVIIGAASGRGAAMAQALSLFDVDAAFSPDPRAALKSLDKNTRIVLVELVLLDATSATIAQIRSAAPRARIIVTVDTLPSVERRAHLLKQGADELLIAPFDVFAVLGKIHAAVHRGRR